MLVGRARGYAGKILEGGTEGGRAGKILEDCRPCFSDAVPHVRAAEDRHVCPFNIIKGYLGVDPWTRESQKHIAPAPGENPDPPKYEADPPGSLQDPHRIPMNTSTRMGQRAAHIKAICCLFGATRSPHSSIVVPLLAESPQPEPPGSPQDPHWIPTRSPAEPHAGHQSSMLRPLEPPKPNESTDLSHTDSGRLRSNFHLEGVGGGAAVKGRSRGW